MFFWGFPPRANSAGSSEQNGYFQIIEGRNGRICADTVKCGENTYLVTFDPRFRFLKKVVGAQREKISSLISSCRRKSIRTTM